MFKNSVSLRYVLSNVSNTCEVFSVLHGDIKAKKYHF